MPILDRPAVVWSAVAYLVAMVAIGVWAWRRTRDDRDFFAAGQSLGLLVTGMAAVASAFSGFVFIGGPGLTYRMGLGSLFICLPLGFTSGLLCWAVAKRMRLLAEVREVYTIPDALRARYGSRATAGLAAVAILLGAVAYLGAQLQALGVIVEAIFGTRALLGEASLPAAMLCGAVVVVFYSVAGGMVASVTTDLVQGLIMAIAASGVFVWALRAVGGVEAMSRRIVESTEFGPAFLDPLGSAGAWTAMGLFFIFAVGSLGQPHVIHKFFMLGDPAKLRWMPAVIGGGQAASVLIWIGIGLAVPALVAAGRIAPLGAPDAAAPTFLLEFVPGPLAGIVFAGILAAIMSTADSVVNIGAAALVRDLPAALGRRRPAQLPWGRAAVVGIAVSAALFAHLYGDLIALLGTFAFGTFGAALAPALAVGLNWKRATAAAATASIGVGLALNLGLEFLARQSFFPGLPPAPIPEGVPPGVVSLAASFAVLVVWSWLARPAVPLDADVGRVMEL